MTDSYKGGGNKRGGGCRKSRWDQPRSKEGCECLPDRKLDPYSPLFNPLKTLYSTAESELPYPNSPVNDNVTKFESVVSGKASTSKSRPPAQPLTYENVPVKNMTETFDNVLKWMHYVEGPLAVLHECIERKIKVKITTRRDCAIRSHVTGYIAAFDKLWNLAIEDATETWTRNKKKKIPALGGVPQATQCNSHLRMDTPVIKVISVNKKTEKCERRVDKIILRGEHVVLPSATLFGLTAGSLLCYMTEWKLILQNVPYYNGKYKSDE